VRTRTDGEMPMRMQVHIEGIQTTVPPPYVGWIAKCLEALDIPHADINHAHVTLVKHEASHGPQNEARVRPTAAGHALQGATAARRPRKPPWSLCST